MLKLLLDNSLIIGVSFYIMLGLTSCSNLPVEKEFPLIGKVSVPFASEPRATPATVINRQDRFKKLLVPASGFITVEEGDTIFSLANRYDVTPYSIIFHNKLNAPFELVSGQVLKLIPRNTHTVRLGDSLFSIAKQYSVNQFEIAQINELEEPYELQSGQIIQLPDVKDFSVFLIPIPDGQVLATESQPGTSSIRQPELKVPKEPIKQFFVAPNLSPGDSFNWPLSGEIVNRFGPAERGIHNDGIDISASFGTDVQTTAPGTVAYVGFGLKSFGTLILVKHNGGVISAYAHLSEVLVKEGDILNSGQIIGKVGQTGRVEFPTLHFEIRQNRTPIDPISIIKS